MPSTGVRTESLLRLREEIESVDRSIVLLLAARLRAAQRALRVRALHGAPLTDDLQERRVLVRGHRWARELGVPEALVDHLLRTLMEEGKARHRRGEAPPGERFVTVLLAGPEGSRPDLRGGAKPQLLAVPPSR